MITTHVELFVRYCKEAHDAIVQGWLGDEYAATRLDLVVNQLRATPNGEIALLDLTTHPMSFVRLFAAENINDSYPDRAIEVLKSLASGDFGEGVISPPYHHVVQRAKQRLAEQQPSPQE